MREYSDLVSTALAAAALAAAVLLSPWLTRALESIDGAVLPLPLHGRHTAGSEPCDVRTDAGVRATCTVLQQDRTSGVVTAGTGKTF